ncbi:hypothetical protein SISSUDRAFT_1044320 [Sistotremastrum suecicum HHB10207 ss-3]|uniref:F-box domain-containing protein n=1 Tax=Sistotremastrum suecicum HHB10207 ss-3 TaxID=1314776 RepID=A0A166F972_9AGAM|nr:hypothetical protein SISSUDRAFT_1044320 [Sistotremastrum suecicum HHB10207 ss-3]
MIFPLEIWRLIVREACAPFADETIVLSVPQYVEAAAREEAQDDTLRSSTLRTRQALVSTSRATAAEAIPYLFDEIVIRNLSHFHKMIRLLKTSPFILPSSNRHPSTYAAFVRSVIVRCSISDASLREIVQLCPGLRSIQVHDLKLIELSDWREAQRSLENLPGLVSLQLGIYRNLKKQFRSETAVTLPNIQFFRYAGDSNVISHWSLPGMRHLVSSSSFLGSANTPSILVFLTKVGGQLEGLLVDTVKPAHLTIDVAALCPRLLCFACAPLEREHFFSSIAPRQHPNLETWTLTEVIVDDLVLGGLLDDSSVLLLPFLESITRSNFPKLRSIRFPALLGSLRRVEWNHALAGRPLHPAVGSLLARWATDGISVVVPGTSSLHASLPSFQE